MFYSQFILAKKGPLGTIWIAAHLERKLRKNQVADTNIGVSVDSIIFPEVPIALRLSSHLLLGVVRIYSRKVNYLFDDCSEALLKIKQAFRSTAVDLPPEESTAPYHSITLPETFDLDDFELPDQDMFQGNYVDQHISNKEQITLQDTLDGVAYSTSQFGLDERFGDGDTSQIGLDLEEDLLLNKPTATESTRDATDLNDVPNTSRHYNDSIKNESDGAMSETPEAMRTKPRGPEDDNGRGELVEYAQAPGTPGLVEVPNLSTQKTLACDDHFEQECHLTESIIHKNQSEALHAPPPGDDGKFFHNPDTICTKENSHNFTEPESDANLETQDAVLGVMKKPQDRYCEDVEMGNNAPPPTILGEAANLKNLPDQLGFSTRELQESSSSLLSNGFQQDGQKTIHSETSNDISVACQREELFPPKNVLASSGLESLDGYSLQACNSKTNLQDTILEGKECPATLDNDDVRRDSMKVQETQCTSSGNFPFTDTTAPVDEMNQTVDTFQQVHANDTVLHEKTESSIAKLGNEVSLSPSMPELPAREKLLSVPEGHAELPTILLLDTTPEKVPSAIEKNGTGVITGQKRSFTESTITADIMHTADSSVKDRLKITAESIPNDEDLLSSILVGRRSSILKLKPSPTQTEVVSLKRPRIAPRSITYKRKVLMDETMVLHGDMIREQLVTTEDIRRVRKKAPCTHQEIWMIQKQFLEEDIVYDPISTGMSMELVCLHNQAYELSGIKIIRDDESMIQTDSTLKMQPPREKIIIPNAKEFGVEEVNVETQLVATFQIENHPREGGSSCVSHDNGVLQKGASTTMLPLAISSEQGQISVMEVDKESGAVVEAAAESSSPTCLNPADIPETAVGSSILLPDGTNDCHNVNYDAYSFDQNNEAKVDNSHIANTNDGDGSAVHIESKTRNQVSPKNSENGGSFEDGWPSGLHTAADTYNHNGDRVDKPSLSVDHDVNTEKLSPSREQIENCNNFDKLQGQMNATAESDTAVIEDLTGMNYTRAEHMAEHDTGFLNVDDDDLEEDESYMPSIQESRMRIVDNSGWSLRTRAVGKYLQIMFDKEAEHGKDYIAIDNLLTGKSRKEASRMFFETLVLKTRDYIHVEQTAPFNNINLTPQSVLMKSDI